jgi:hypothetical protein
MPAISRLCSAVLVAGVVLAGAGAAYPFEITQSIPNSDVLACLDVKGSSTDSGTAVESYPCNDGFNEQWALVAGAPNSPTGSSAFFEVYNTSGNAARCLSVANTNAIIIGDCNSSTPTWFLNSSGNLSTSSGLCLDSQGDYGSGAQAIVDPCSGAASQMWELKNILIAQPIPGTSNTACANVRNKSIANGTPVDAYPCTMGDNTFFTYVNSQLQGIVTNTVSTCLAATGNDTVELQNCNGSQTQSWVINSQIASGGGVEAGIVVESVATPSFCLDSQGNYGGTAQLAITQCAPTAADSQLWKLH